MLTIPEAVHTLAATPAIDASTSGTAYPFPRKINSVPKHCALVFNGSQNFSLLASVSVPAKL